MAQPTTKCECDEKICDICDTCQRCLNEDCVRWSGVDVWNYHCHVNAMLCDDCSVVNGEPVCPVHPDGDSNGCPCCLDKWVGMGVIEYYGERDNAIVEGEWCCVGDCYDCVPSECRESGHLDGHR